MNLFKLDMKTASITNTRRKIHNGPVAIVKINKRYVEFCNPILNNHQNSAHLLPEILKFCNKHGNKIYEFLHDYREKIQVNNYISIFKKVFENKLQDRPLDEILVLLKLYGEEK